MATGRAAPPLPLCCRRYGRPERGAGRASASPSGRRALARSCARSWGDPRPLAAGGHRRSGAGARLVPVRAGGAGGPVGAAPPPSPRPKSELFSGSRFSPHPAPPRTCRNTEVRNLQHHPVTSGNLSSNLRLRAIGSGQISPFMKMLYSRHQRMSFSENHKYFCQNTDLKEQVRKSRKSGIRMNTYNRWFFFHYGLKLLLFALMFKSITKLIYLLKSV
ncbi:uncharacterized protein LOC115334458 [Aquila chrysaetos chrysaetos]|uniref:uncharacterized protein LOC115334458 n=1 Tax=Aquila chrysaetos chrysaetos TaxID=223781 RepID=UPI0011770E75|nr:uncharacterized protein LOC115334458 [Aquila chrysaetos chrysaetos]